MRGRKGRFLFTIFLVIIVFGLGTRIVNAQPVSETPGKEAQESGNDDAETEEDLEGLQEEVQDALLSEFDFSDVEDSLKDMFPGERTGFGDVLSALMTGDIEETGSIFLSFLRDQISYEFDYNRKSLVYVLLVAITAAVFSNFAGAFQNRQISDISFYITYMLLITLCLTSFQTSAAGLEDRLGSLLDFMRVLCPSYFLAVAFASGTTTSLFFLQCDPVPHLCCGVFDCKISAAGHKYLHYGACARQSDGRGLPLRICRPDTQDRDVGAPFPAGMRGGNQRNTGTPCSGH